MSKKHHDHVAAPPYFSLNFTGRIGRLEFANRFVTYMVLFVAIYLLYFFIFEKGLFSVFDLNDKSIDMTKNLIRLIFYSGYSGAVILLNIRIAIMRLHDINLSGWWSCVLFIFPYLTDLMIIMLPMTLSQTLFYILFGFFAVIGLLARIFPFVMPGNKGINKYGAPAKKSHPYGLILLIIILAVICYYTYQYITLQSISVGFLNNL